MGCGNSSNKRKEKPVSLHKNSPQVAEVLPPVPLFPMVIQNLRSNSILVFEDSIPQSHKIKSPLFMDASGVSINHCIYITGGSNNFKNTISKRNLRITVGDSLNEDKMKPLSIKRKWHKAVGQNQNTFWVIAGFDSHQYLDHCETYQISTDTWKQMPLLNQKKALISATSLGEIIFVFGGLLNGDEKSNLIEKYDPKSQNWKIEPAQLPSAGTHFGVVSKYNTRYNKHIIIFGGTDAFQDLFPGPNVYIFQPSKNLEMIGDKKLSIEGMFYEGVPCYNFKGNKIIAYEAQNNKVLAFEVTPQNNIN